MGGEGTGGEGTGGGDVNEQSKTGGDERVPGCDGLVNCVVLSCGCVFLTSVVCAFSHRVDTPSC